MIVDLRQLLGDEFPEIAPFYWLKTIALLMREAQKAFDATAIRFDSEPDRFGIGDLPWAGVELADGTVFVLVQHHELGEKLEVRAREGASGAVDLLHRLCDAAGIAPELVVAVADQPNPGAAAVGELPPEGRFSGFWFRLRDPSCWGYQRVLTGALRTRISTRAMKRLPTRYASYAPAPAPATSTTATSRT
jgi:hypothetical protein